MASSYFIDAPDNLLQDVAGRVIIEPSHPEIERATPARFMHACMRKWGPAKLVRMTSQDNITRISALTAGDRCPLGASS